MRIQHHAHLSPANDDARARAASPGFSPADDRRNLGCVFSMNLEVDLERVRLAYKTVRAELLAERSADGHWIGQMSSSPLATAAAVSALVVAHDGDTENALATECRRRIAVGQRAVDSRRPERAARRERPLAGPLPERRRRLGRLRPVAIQPRGHDARAGRVSTDRRPGQVRRSDGAGRRLCRRARRRRRTAAIWKAANCWPPILANCALAGMVPWRQVPTLPFELACVPPHWQRMFRLPVDPHTRARAAGRGPRQVPSRSAAQSAHAARPPQPCAKSLRLLERLQAADGSFLDSTPLTAFVVMSLASERLPGTADRRARHRVPAGLGAADASWSVYSNQAARNTALAIRSSGDCADASHRRRIGRIDRRTQPGTTRPVPAISKRMSPRTTNRHHRCPSSPRRNRRRDHQRLDSAGFDWLLDRQHTRSQPNALTSARRLGTERRARRSCPTSATRRPSCCTLARSRFAPARHAASASSAPRGSAVRWLLDVQNDDGGWPTFYRSDDFLFADQPSGTDLTAHALRRSPPGSASGAPKRRASYRREQHCRARRADCPPPSTRGIAYL